LRSPLTTEIGRFVTSGLPAELKLSAEVVEVLRRTMTDGAPAVSVVASTRSGFPSALRSAALTPRLPLPWLKVCTFRNADTLAENTTGESSNPAPLASTVLATGPPTIQRTDARPSAPVTAVAADSEPPPAVTRKLTL
jgi:hypothetical protein